MSQAVTRHLIFRDFVIYRKKTHNFSETKISQYRRVQLIIVDNDLMSCLYKLE